MNSKKLKFALLGLLICICSLLSAQDDKKDAPITSVITMDNGDKFIGFIVEESTNVVTVKTDNATLQLDRSHVKSIKEKTYTGKFRFKNPNDTRYFFGTTALQLEEGRGYYQNTYAIINSFNYGITKNFSMGGGFEFISLTKGNPFWFLTPKVGFKVRDNLHLGVGSLIVGYEKDVSALNYGTATLGNADTNLTLGVGVGTSFTNGLDSEAILNIGGKHRITNSISLVTENYIFMDQGTVETFGIHGISIMSTNNSFDLGFIVIPTVAEELPAIPYVSYVRKI